MKKYFPFAISFTVLIAVLLLWDYIKLPYNEGNNIVGEYYYKKINPLNDTIKFLSFVILPCLVYFIFYLRFNNNTYSFKPWNSDYFLKKKRNNDQNSLVNYFFFFIILIIIEFFSLDFSRFLGSIDLYHSGTYLVPPLNYLETGGLFRSTFYDYGFIANNLGLIFNSFFGYYTWGSIVFLKLALVFFNKFFLILISKNIISTFNLEKFSKKILFILFTFIAISLPNYYNFYNFFSPRHALYLSFIFLLIVTLCNYKHENLKFFSVGFFSSLSILWWYDIGVYINLLILFTAIYLLIHKEKKNLFLLIFGIVISWMLIFVLLPLSELKEFFVALKFIFSTSNEYLLGLEFLKPFSQNSGRFTKALVLLYITGLMLVNLNFSKNFYINYKTKISINVIFISSLIVFKSALMRSDSWHIKYSSGLYTLVFLGVLLLFFFIKLDSNKRFKNFITNSKPKNLTIITFLFFITCSITVLSGTTNKYDKKIAVDKIKNIFSFKQNINTLIKAEDNLYLNENTKKIIAYYKKLSKNDSCFQTIADEVSFAYLLKKPSCTQFYIPVQIISGVTESKFIEQLSKNSPEFLLYDSPNKVQLNRLNMPNALNYINEKYSFFENYNGYIIYKIKT